MIPQQPQLSDDQHPLLKANLRYYSVKEIASILDTSERSVYRHIEAGLIKAVHSPYNKRGIKVPRAEVLRLHAMMTEPIRSRDGG